MHQQIPPTIDHYGLQPQMNTPLVIYPVQFVCDAQIVIPPTPVPEEVRQQPVLLNVQNTPPWIQNRQPQNVIYIQQMPNQILPYVQQNVVQNHVYPPSQFNYQAPQQIISQDMITPILGIPSNIQNKTENHVVHSTSNVTQKMPILTQLLNKKPLEIQEKPAMQSQHVQTDFPLKNNKKPCVAIQQNIALNNQNETPPKEVNELPQLDPSKFNLDLINNKGPDEEINSDIPPLVKSKHAGGISIQTSKPMLRPIVTPSGMKSNIPIKLRALDPTQVISIPNYGTITNYTVLNEDNDVRIPTEIQNISTVPNINNDNIITAKLNEKNEITFVQNAQKPENNYLSGAARQIMTSNAAKVFSIGTNTLVSNDARKVTNRTATVVSNEAQTTRQVVANSISKPFSINSTMSTSNDTEKAVTNETLISNDIHKTVPNDNTRLVLNEITGSFQIEAIKTTTTETTKPVTMETQKAITTDTPKQLRKETSKSVAIEPETIKSIEVEKITRKVNKKKGTEFEKPPVKTVKTKAKKEPKTKTIKEIKKKIAAKNAVNEKTKKDDVYILTHVLEGHVIQESNVAFPICVPAKENYSYEPFPEATRRKRTKEPLLPLKNLQVDDNTKPLEEPVQDSVVPNGPVTIHPAEALIQTPEVRPDTNETRELTADSVNKVEEVSNEAEAMPVDPPEIETLPKLRPKVAVVTIERYKFATVTNDRPEVVAASTDSSEVGAMLNNLPEVAALPTDCSNIATKSNNHTKIPMVAIERLNVRSMSSSPNEEAAGSVASSELIVDSTIESINGSVESEVNISSASQAKRDDNPFSTLQKSALEEWDMETLYSYLIENNWKEAADKLKDQEIDGEALLLARKDQLITIGVNERQADIINDFINSSNTMAVEAD